MTPDPDATAAPPEPASAPAALSAPERRAVEAAVAGAAGLLLGRVLLGRAGGLATGLAALGVGLLGKCPPPRSKTDEAEPGPNGNGEHPSAGNGAVPHAPASAPSTSAQMMDAMRVRLQTSPVPPLDAVAALARAEAGLGENFGPVAVAVSPVPEAVSLPEPDIMPAAEPEPVAAAEVFPPMEEAMPAAVVEESVEDVSAAAQETAPAAEFLTVSAAEVPLPVPVAPEMEIEDAGAFAEMPALFEARAETAPVPPVPEVSYHTPLSPAAAPAVESLPLTDFLRRAENDLEATPPPITAPVPPLPRTAPVPSAQAPSGRTTPLIGLLDDLPVEFAELKEEQEPGPREDFLIVPDETPKPVPALEPVVAALSIPLTRSDFEPSPFLMGPVVEPVEPPAAVAAPAADTGLAEDAQDLLGTATAETPAPVAEVVEEPFLGNVRAAPEAEIPPQFKEPAPWTAPVFIPDPHSEDWSNMPAFPDAPAVSEMPDAPVQEVPVASMTSPFMTPVAPATGPVLPPIPQATPATAPVAPPMSATAPVMLPPIPPDASATAPVMPVPPPANDTAPVLPVLPVESATAPVAPLTPATTPVAYAGAAMSNTAPVPPVLPASATATATAPVPPVPFFAAAGEPVPPSVVPGMPTDLAALLQDGTSPFPPAPAAAPWTIDPSLSPSVPPPPPETIAVSLPPLPPAAPPSMPQQSRVRTAPVMPPPPAPESEPMAESPFLLHRTPAIGTSPVPAPAPMPIPAPVPGLVPGPVRPVPDPEEIWRQAAAELATFRTDPVPPAFPPPVGAPGGTGPFPAAPDTSLAPPFPEAVPAPSTAPAPAPPTGTVPAPGTPPAELPPWLKTATAPAPEPEEEAHKGHEAEPFLPTIRLEMPRGPQPGVVRRPIPISDAPHLDTSAVQPTSLPGYRAESLTSAVPLPNLAPPPAPADAPPPLPLPGALPPLPVPPLPDLSPAPILPGAPAAGNAAPPPLSFNGPGKFAAPASADDKVYVERHKSSRSPSPKPYKKKTLTPLRVGLVVMLAVAALCLAFKDTLVPWLKERILGRPPAGKTAPKPSVPAPAKPDSVPGDGSDVKVVPDSSGSTAPGPDGKTKPVPPPNKTSAVPAVTPSPAEPVPAPVSPADPAVPATAATAPLPDSEPLPPPPPATSPDNANEPLPVTEAGAKELINRLLYATSARQVRPWILDESKLGPGVETYFNAGKSVPVSTHLCELTRDEKIPGTNRMMWQFKVTTDTVEGGFPVLVEQTADGLRADWELLTQCRDLQFQKWMADTTAGPARFYMGLQRRHPFADMLPAGRDPDRFLAFAIAPPILGEPSTFAFIPLGTPLAARAAKLYDFATPRQAPVLELAHKDGHVEIISIVRETWRAPAKK